MNLFYKLKARFFQVKGKGTSKERIVMTLLVRDESDILEMNILYHLSVGVDFFIITDNKSVDNTAAIIKKYEKKGLAKYIYEPNDNFSQNKWVTNMAIMAHDKYGADWVINNDADEFWWTPLLDLKKELGLIPTDIGVVAVNRYNFVPRKETGQPFYETMDVKEKITLNSLGQPIEGKAFHRGCGAVIVTMGNHNAIIPETHPHKKMTSLTMEIFHYPLRNFKQFENKIVKGGSALNSNTELHKEMGAGWRRLLELHEKKELKSYYDSQFFSDEQIQLKMAAGILVKDTRFTSCLKGLESQK
jgi:glycosyltransferase involved in cell wall biosynthesis